MFRVDTTDSFTPASTRPGLDPALNTSFPTLPVWHWLRALICASWMALLLPWSAHAREPETLQLTLQRTADGLFLSARLGLSPAHAVEDALQKSVPLYFVWQADVYRKRWYWTDKRVSSAVRTLRLAYQPLTRRWRLSLSNDAGADSGGAGLQYALHQNYATLADALAGVGRISRWRIADGPQADSADRVELAFRLDLSLLPRPFQIGMVNQPDWTVELQRELRVPEHIEAEKSTEPLPDKDKDEAEADVAEPQR